MRGRVRRGGALLLLTIHAISASGCSTWRQQPQVTPYAMHQAEGKAIRVHLLDGSVYTPTSHSVAGPTLTMALDSDSARSRSRVVPMDSVRQFVLKGVSAGRTVGLIGGIFVVVMLALGLAVEASGGCMGS